MRATICSTMCLLNVIITKSFCRKEKSSYRKPGAEGKHRQWGTLRVPSQAAPTQLSLLSSLFFNILLKNRQEREKPLAFCLSFLTVCISCSVFVACCCPFSSSPNSHSHKLKVTLLRQQRLNGKTAREIHSPSHKHVGFQITGGKNNVF